MIESQPLQPEQPDEFTAFLQREAANDAEARELDAWVQNFTVEFYAYLGSQGVPHDWHPDPEQQKLHFALAVDRITRTMVQDGEGHMTHLAGTWATMSQNTERRFAVETALAVRSAYDGGDAAEITLTKKALQAEMKLSGYPDEWLDAVGMCIPGPSLELDREEDLELYTEIQESRDQSSESPLARSVGAIFRVYDWDEAAVNGPGDLAATTRRNAAIIRIATDFFQAADVPASIPNTAAAIDEELRAGTVTPDEAAALHELLKGLSHD